MENQSTPNKSNIAANELLIKLQESIIIDGEDNLNISVSDVDDNLEDNIELNKNDLELNNQKQLNKDGLELNNQNNLDILSEAASLIEMCEKVVKYDKSNNKMDFVPEIKRKEFNDNLEHYTNLINNTSSKNLVLAISRSEKINKINQEDDISNEDLFKSFNSNNLSNQIIVNNVQVNQLIDTDNLFKLPFQLNPNSLPIQGPLPPPPAPKKL